MSGYDRTGYERNKRRRKILKAAGWRRTDIHYDPNNERHREIMAEINGDASEKIKEISNTGETPNELG